MSTRYLFESERLGFRNWKDSDFQEFAKINADIEVMEHFPYTLSLEDTKGFIQRLQQHFEKRGYNYFAVEVMTTGELIGFIGLAYQEYETEFTPAVDIGWRLKKSAWGHGYATEGAKRCLDFAFNNLHLEKVISICTIHNKQSENIMQKIGMTRMGIFNHPKLKEHTTFERCIWYELSNSAYNSGEK